MFTGISSKISVEGIKIPYQQKNSETNSFMTTIKVKLINSYFVVVFIKF